ncbi:hypothetical protein MNEG_6225 [Monoraphidium neglectum]|jgi:hypothetical protein|uniref:Uncharacterized protein n=1 Tax=Monoraphidium neglectum TaxID=145388 RepID=A0A0D2MMF7_9CHLO|nr:hypothetical protein MNEG_6225 [Monoraphidium neglectum]KIZ01737.1 hypothetical protein MNEG_6225 [Monoraphidium neglectum]|eukprot:XP_013900756.1 hypothetical protein MNEG_6225 [Monoraphidium neglectum]
MPAAVTLQQQAGGAPASINGADNRAPNEGTASAALIALGLPRIAAPPVSGSGAAAEAATQAFDGVVRAAGALGLGPEQLYEVCTAVEAATTRDAAASHVFLGITYRRLQMACASGQAAAARAWMGEMAERGGV